MVKPRKAGRKKKDDDVPVFLKHEGMFGKRASVVSIRKMR